MIQTFFRYSLGLIAFSVLCTGCLDQNNPQNQFDNPNPPELSVWDSVMNIINQYNPNREVWQKPDLVLDQLGNIEGKLIADVGAGSGYFTFLIPQRGADVIAIDIDSSALNGIRESMQLPNFPEEYRDNIELRLVPHDDPLLGNNEVDAVIIINTVAYIDNRVNYLEKVLNGMKPGGTLLIVDYKTRRIPLNIPLDYRVPLYQVEEDLYQAGFNSIQADDCALEFQYIIKATKA